MLKETKEKYKQRGETIAILKNAIDELKNKNYPLTITNICHVSGLSRATMYKEHTKKFLTSNGIHMIARSQSLGIKKQEAKNEN